MILRQQPPFTFGIEEEYFLVSTQTRALVDEPPSKMLDECRTVLGEHFSAEYQRSQIEVATKICRSMSEAREDLAHLRSRSPPLRAAMDKLQSLPLRIPSRRGAPSATLTSGATTQSRMT
jgi:gamma-glutamyl:cysteine ligase YbdK (ATP-grasp superfamily)